MRTKFAGAMPWRTSPCASVRPSTIPGQIPAAEPIRAMIAASQAIMRRICPGVAATALSSAISRSRCWIERLSVLATTNMAMNSASPPNAAVTGIRVVRVASSSGYSPCPRAAPVSTCAPEAAARTRLMSKPGPASRPIASTRPGWPASAVASASVRKIALCWVTGSRGRATPTTVTMRVRAVDASGSRAPSAAG